MDKQLQIKLGNVLKAEADYINRSEEDIQTRFKKMNEILNLLKIIDNYDELEPVLKKYFQEKADKTKFER